MPNSAAPFAPRASRGANCHVAALLHFAEQGIDEHGVGHRMMTLAERRRFGKQPECVEGG